MEGKQGRNIRKIASLCFMLAALDAWSDTLNVPADYATIQLAVDMADAGDTVKVADGSYLESINIGKKLKLVGLSSPHIQGDIVVIANQVTIEGFEIFGTVELQYDSGRVRENTIFAPTDDDVGILVSGNRNELLDNVLFLGNWGIRITGNNNDVEGNEVGNPYRHSIYVQGVGNHIEDNDVFGAILGILVEGEGHAIEDNRAFRNVTGIYVDGVGHRVTGNDAENNFEDGITVAGNNSIYEDLNQAEDNGVFGFRIVPGATGNIIRDNEGDSNERSGFFVAGSSNTFEGNGAENNSQFGFEEYTGASSNTYVNNDCEDNGIAPSNVAGLCD